jgi:inner membrane protein
VPTIVSHAAIPLALGLGLGKNRISRPLLGAGIIASMLPDADVILFRLGATYDTAWSHRGFSHSLAFAIFLGLIAAIALRRVARPLVAFGFVAIAAASHGLLDMMTNGGHGIAILWPVTDQRYFFDWRPIRVAPLALNRFPARAAAIVRTELLWIWVPAFLVALGLRSWRRREGASA